MYQLRHNCPVELDICNFYRDSSLEDTTCTFHHCRLSHSLEAGSYSFYPRRIQVCIRYIYHSCLPICSMEEEFDTCNPYRCSSLICIWCIFLRYQLQRNFLGEADTCICHQGSSHSHIWNIRSFNLFSRNAQVSFCIYSFC